MDGAADDAAGAAPVIDVAARFPGVRMSEGIPATVPVYHSGGSIILELAGLTTWGEAREQIERQGEGFDMTNKAIVTENDDLLWPSGLESDLPLDGIVPAEGVAIKEYYTMTVEHAGFLISVPVLFAARDKTKWTVGYIKRAAEAQRESGDSLLAMTLTWKGQPVQDGLSVDELEGGVAAVQADEKLVGHKTLIIHDLDLGENEQAELTRVQDHQKMEVVLQEYQRQQRRLFLCQPIIAQYNEQLTADTIADTHASNLLDQQQSVYSTQLPHNGIVALKTRMFEVIVKEQSDLDKARNSKKALGGAAAAEAAAASAAGSDVPGQRVRVFDWSTVRFLKDQYSLVVPEVITSSDQLVLDTGAGSAAGSFDGELEDNDKLFKYSVQEGSVLLVKREDFTQPACFYTCADCGSDVKLKQRDAVRCRECGHRIVFKKRINKPCQYLCR